MDLKALEFDWNRAKAFFVSAEEGSFSKASKKLKVSQTTLGRQVAALEENLGLLLFNRVGNGLQLTTAGKALLNHVKQMAEAAGSFSLTASGNVKSLEGSVCISAAESFAYFLLPEMVLEMRKQQPGIEIEIVSSNESSDLRKREADLAIRNYRPTPNDLVARKLTEENFYIYMSDAYIQRHGKIKSFKEANQAVFIGFEEQANLGIISELNASGFDLSPTNFSVRTKSHLVHWQMAIQGVGLGLMAARIGDKDPRMHRVLEKEMPPLKYENWLVSHRELKTNPRIRFVFDYIANHF